MAAARAPLINVTHHHGSSAAAAAPATAAQPQHSPWHSPVPYLFGGLAAMLGLIAFALLILACSYWKLSGYLEGGEGGDGERDLEAGEGGKDENLKAPPAFEEKILVIMAGQMKPTYLATPISSRSSSFGDSVSSSSSCSSCGAEKSEKSVEMAEREKKQRSSGTDDDDDDQVQIQDHLQVQSSTGTVIVVETTQQQPDDHQTRETH